MIDWKVNQSIAQPKLLRYAPVSLLYSLVYRKRFQFVRARHVVLIKVQLQSETALKARTFPGVCSEATSLRRPLLCGLPVGFCCTLQRWAQLPVEGEEQGTQLQNNHAGPSSGRKPVRCRQLNWHWDEWPQSFAWDTSGSFVVMKTVQQMDTGFGWTMHAEV